MSTQDTIQRSVLPIPHQPYVGLTTYDARIRTPSSPLSRNCCSPKAAPNVLIVLLDDVGFGASSVFGGPCQTPVFEQLAADGLRYNRFHTTALCHPTRAALLTGRNHHTAGFGVITEMAEHQPRLQHAAPEYSCALGRDPETEWLQHGAVWQVP